MASTEIRCDLDPALFTLGGKWKTLILHHLSLGTCRYGELRRAVGLASDKVLIQQLKEMEADGIVVRHDHDEVPPRVDYALTAAGVLLEAAVAPLVEWVIRHPTEVQNIMRRRTAPSS